MSFFTYALGAIILILVLLRQVRIRPTFRDRTRPLASSTWTC